MKDEGLTTRVRRLADPICAYVGLLYDPAVGIEALHDFRDLLSRGQLQSKLLLLDAMHQHKLKAERALFLGSWNGFFPLLAHNFGIVRGGVGYELSSHWVTFSNRLNSGWAWSAHQKDIDAITEPLADFDCIFNTSCEHMSDRWIEFVPEGTLVVAQSNDYQIPEHTNTCYSLEEFKSKLALREIIFEFEKRYDVYTRYTLIGRR